MSLLPLILSLTFACLLDYSFALAAETSRSIARFGTSPTIDGVFEDGEWDDAETVQAGQYQQFRLKHDGTNLYFAVVGDGGNLWFNKDRGLRVLHASAQLGSVETRHSYQHWPCLNCS